MLVLHFEIYVQVQSISKFDVVQFQHVQFQEVQVQEVQLKPRSSFLVRLAVDVGKSGKTGSVGPVVYTSSHAYSVSPVTFLEKTRVIQNA